MWQDIALSFLGIIFTLNLLPQLKDIIYKKGCLNTITCLTTGVGCIIVGFIDITLHLSNAAFVSVITGIIWLLLLIFSIKNSKNPPIQQKCLNRDVSNNSIERG